MLPIFLSCTLVFGLLVSGAFAWSSDSERTLDFVFDSQFLNKPTYDSNYSALKSFIDTYYSEGKNITVAKYPNYLRVAVHDGMLWDNGNFIRCSVSAPIYYIILYDAEVSSFPSYLTVVPSGGGTTDFGIYWYYNSTFTNFPSNSTMYSTTSFYSNSGLISSNNLTLGTFNPDSRIFEVWKTVDYPESSNPLEYINVRVDDGTDLDKISSQKIRFDYTDHDGNHLYKVFNESDFHDIRHVDDCFEFYIFPYLISSYEFTLTESTYYPDLVEWGSKTIDLDITFNEDVIYPLPQDWNSVYTVNQYFQSSSNGTINAGVTKLALSSFGSYWIDNNQRVCHQVFDVKSLFIPYFMNSDLLSINLETLFQLYEQYDVIFTGVQPTQFNLLIPTLDYNDLMTYYSLYGFYPALQKLQEAYVFYSNLEYQKNYSDYFWSVSTDDVGFIVTRSFLFKRALAALGDVDDRLLEFEENLVGEDSLGASLQNKLDNILSQENSFFSDVSRFFQKLEYGLNGVSFSNIEKWLKEIRDSLVGEFHFDFEVLEHPWLDIYEFVKALFDDGTAFLGDFTASANAMLNGSSMTSLPISTITVTPALPFNPTPIPIPTIQGGG